MVTEATQHQPSEQSPAPERSSLATYLSRIDEGITEFLITRPMLVVVFVALGSGYILTSHMTLTEATLGSFMVVPVGYYYLPLTIMTGVVLAILAFTIGRLAATVEEARSRELEARAATEAVTAALEGRNKAERRLHEAHTRLEASNTTIEEWAAELEETNARLHKLDSTKTSFISEVSHEIRGPLAAMVSAAKIIRKHHQAKPEIVNRFSGTIITEGDRLSRLINDFLDLAKLEAGCIDWKVEDIAALELVNAALLRVEPLALERGVLLSSSVGDNMPLLNVDGERITQVLANLLAQAIANTPEGGSVSIRIERADKKFVFAVSDTGAGIPSEERETLFTSFKRIGSGPISGTGLGLCISKEIVELYGGRIWAEMTVGEGNTFRFTIPDEGVASLHKNADVVSVMSTRSQSIRVAFFCDDQALVDRALSMPLSSGVECRIAADIAELDELLRSWTPDCLLVTQALFDAAPKPLMKCAQENGMIELLVYSSDGEINARSVKASSEIAVRRLHYYCSWGSKILLVEDNEEYRNIVKCELEHQGYKVLTAVDGQQALEIIDEEKPDGIILDVVIPRVDGLSVLAYVTENDLQIPTIVLTGAEDPTVAVSAQKLGADEVIHKNGQGHVARAAVVARLQRVMRPALAGRAQSPEPTETPDGSA